MSNASTPNPDSRAWMLVRWEGQRSVFPEYSVLRLNSIMDDTRDVQIGNMIMLRCPRELLSRRALVLKFSDSRSTLLENKQLLDSQNKGLRAAFSTSVTNYQDNNNRVASYEIAASPTEFSQNIYRDRFDCVISSYSNVAQTRHSIRNSTAFKSRARSVADQATQTDSTDLSLEKRNELKKKRFLKSLKHLYTQCIIAFAHLQDLRNIVCDAPPALKRIPKVEALLQNPMSLLQNAIEHSNAVEQENSIVSQDQNILAIGNENEHPQEIETEHINSNNTVSQTTKKSARNKSVDTNQNNSNDTDAVMEEATGKENVEPNVSSKNRHTVKINLSQYQTPQRVRRVSAHTTNIIDDDLVPLGSGHALVRGRLLQEIDWTSHTSATRHLLQAVFSRKVLATHSLTGKPSPAFTNKPAKKQLDQNIVSDIVATVSQRCEVTPRMVRNCITIKCTDEAKLYRKRQRLKSSMEEPDVPTKKPANEGNE